MDRTSPIRHYSFFEFCLFLFLHSISECGNVLPLLAKHAEQICLYNIPFVSWDFPYMQEFWLKYVQGIDFVILVDFLKEFETTEDAVCKFGTCF